MRMRAWLAFLALAAVGVFTVVHPALAASLIPRKVIFGNPERASPLISPDGAQIAFLAPLNGVMNIWVAPVGALAAARPVTSEKRRPIRWFLWAKNGTHVLYQQDEGGDENFQIFAANLATGKVANLTPYRGARAMIVAGSYQRPDEILVGLNSRDPKWHDIWLINTVSGKAILIEKNEGIADYVADDALNLRLALKTTPDGGTVVLRRTGAKWTSFFDIPPDDSLTTYPLAIQSDGRTLLMLDSRNRDKAALVAMDLLTAGTKLIGVSAKADIAHKILDPMTSAPLAFGAEYERTAWTAVSSAIKADLDVLAKAIPGAWSVISQSANNDLWTLRIDNVVEPVKFALYDRKTKKLSTLFVARPALSGKPLARMTPVVIKARDGLEIVSYLTLPRGIAVDRAGRPLKPLPMVLNVHGGPWARNSFGYDPEHQWLANRGYAVLSVNFRGSTGFGKAFVNAADREWAGKMHDDLIDAVNWAVGAKIAQPDKIAIFGGSYGGYAALVGVTFTPKTFACGVSIVGPSNLNTLLASIPPYWESLLDTFRRRVGDPTTPEGKALLTARSPLFKAGDIERPLLIAQGANDPRVKQAESTQIVDAMTAKNIPVTYVLYADEGHGFARPENRMSFFAVSEAFLADCLGGGAEPIADSFQGSSIAVPNGKEFVPGLSEALGMVKPN
jgi:dipeptidyl aminopeptidase/acylaminoacyl peptidase